jgi:uncharacterized protein (DUF849 family)
MYHSRAAPVSKRTAPHVTVPAWRKQAGCGRQRLLLGGEVTSLVGVEDDLWLTTSFGGVRRHCWSAARS